MYSVVGNINFPLFNQYWKIKKIDQLLAYPSWFDLNPYNLINISKKSSFPNLTFNLVL